MKYLMRIFPVALVAGLSISAFAFDDFDYKVANIDILRDKNVQKDLGISEAQRSKMNVFADKYSKANNDKVAEYQKAKKQPDQAFYNFTRDQFLSLRTNILNTLTAAQVKRLRELTIRAVGPRALMDKVVADKVGMSSAEYSKFIAAIREGDQKIAKIKSEIASKIREKYKSQKPPKNKQETDALNKKLNADLEAETKKRASELNAIKAQSEKKTAAIVKKEYLSRLQALMGKPFSAGAPASKGAPSAKGKKPAGKKGG